MQPVVATAHGSVRGTLLAGAVAAFKGISYAAPPFGPNRFLPPRPPEPWPDVRDALEYGPTAPQAPYAPPFDTLLPEIEIPGEDCLNLNLWTPDPGGSAPVLVWLHGGAFTNGSGSLPGYDGTRFARDGVVLVTVNYRLGAEGFLYLGDGAPNLGLLDQIAALTWVRENIAGFGGDPGRVTVVGESAGAMSIGALLAMPRAHGLFQRAILQSGAAHHTLSPATARLLAERLAESLGVEPVREAFAQVPLGQVVAAQQRLRAEISDSPDPARWGEAALNLMPFEPVVDGDILPNDPAKVTAAGAGADVDLLIGTNSDEFRLFLVPTGLFDLIPEAAVRASAAGYGLDPAAALDTYRTGHPDAGPGELFSRIVTDWFYRIPAVRLAEAYASRRAGSAHLYEFAWQPATFDRRIGACHASELPFVFDNLHDKSFTALLGPNLPQQIADTMHSAWVAFATTGDPGWPPYDAATRSTMRFDTDSKVIEDPHARERALWDGHR